MPRASIRYVGLDVHKRILEACVIDKKGKVLARRRLESFNRDSLARFAETFLRKGDRVALEATTNTWAVVHLLAPYVASVTVSNPMQTKAIASAKVKTDKVDANVLAQLLRMDYLPTVWMPDEKTRELRELTSRRAALVSQRTAVRNRIHATLSARLIDAPLKLFSSKQRVQELRELEIDETGRIMLDVELDLHEAIERQIDAIESELAKRGYADDRVKLLMTIPGVNVAVAESILAAIGDVSRFESPDQMSSYLGLVPSTRQSANKCYHGPITKRGRSHTRWMLVQAAQHLDKHPGPLGHFFRRLLRKKNRNVAVVAVARKLAMIAWHMLTNNEPYRYAIPRSTEEKLRALRVRATGERRKLGPPKGVKPKALCPGGGRTIRSLDGVLESEGLPPRRELSSGERRTVKQADAIKFHADLGRSKVVPRSKKKT